MRIFKIILLSIVAIAVLLAIVGFLLPSKYSVSRSIVINAPAEKVYALIAAPREWARWTVWNRRDPAMKITYSGPASGQGAKWAWDSKSEGTGWMEFTAAEPNRRVEYILVFPEFETRSRGALTLLPEGSATGVTWAMSGEVGANPFKHYFAAFMDRMVGPDFEGGLANLKALAEKP
jgi:uncharacterized protein YndB with AHSA1/START domain